MSQTRKISVIGLGYVGLRVAVAFGTIGPVLRFDVNPIVELYKDHNGTA